MGLLLFLLLLLFLARLFLFGLFVGLLVVARKADRMPVLVFVLVLVVLVVLVGLPREDRLRLRAARRALLVAAFVNGMVSTTLT